MQNPIKRALSKGMLVLAMMLLGSATWAHAQVAVTAPTVSADVGEQVSIPLTVTNTDGRNITSYEFTLAFDSSVLSVTGIQTSNTLTGDAGFAAVANTNTAGQVRVAAAGATALQGEGTLLIVTGTVVGAGTTALTFNDFTFNNGTPVASTVNGQLNASGLSATLGSASAEEGQSFTLDLDIDDITGKGITSYEFTLNYDPSLITLSGVETSGTLSEGISVVSNNPQAGQLRVAAASATEISGAAGTPLLKITGTANTAGNAAITFSNVSFSNASGGNVAVGTTGGTVAVAGVMVTLPTVNAELGTTGTLPVSISDVTGDNITSFEVTFTYNPSVISIQGVSATGTLAGDAGFSVVGNSPSNGVYKIAGAGATALTGDGTLVNINYEATALGTSQLDFTEITLNNGTPSGIGVDGQVTVRINTDPVANNDAYSVDEDNVLTVDAPGVLGNDTDADGDPLTASVVTTTSNGTLSLNANGSFTYTPNANFNGTDTFTYRASDGTDNSGNATVTITVNAVGDAPVFTATLADATIQQTETLTFDFDASDTEGEAITFSLVDAPANAEIDAATGEFSFTPGIEQSGDYTITVKATDASGDSATTTATVTVTEVPVLTIAQARRYAEGSLVRVKGTVTRAFNRNAWIQENVDGVITGIVTFNFSGPVVDGIADGSIRERTVLDVIGEIDEFNGLLQIRPVAASVLSQTGDYTVQPVTLEELEQTCDADTYESEIVHVTDLMFAEDVRGTLFESSTTYDIFLNQFATEAGGDVKLRVQSSSSVDGLVGTTIPDNFFRFEGPVGEFRGTCQLTPVRESDVFQYSDVSTPTTNLPTEFVIDAAYPNPMRATGAVRFDLPEAAQVRFEVIDLLGRTVIEMAPQQMAPAFGLTIAVDANDLASGTYVYRLTADMAGDTQTKIGKLIVVK